MKRSLSHYSLGLLMACSLGLLVASGCAQPRKLQVSVLVKPRVDFGQHSRIEALRLDRIQGSGSAGNVAEAFKAALMGALARKPQYQLLDAQFEAMIREMNLIGREGIGVLNIDAGRTVTVNAQVVADVWDQREVQQEEMILSSTNSAGQVRARPIRIPVYYRKVGGNARVDLTLQLPDGETLERSYGPYRDEQVAKIGQGDALFSDRSVGQRTLPSVAEVRSRLLERLAEEILADLSPHEEEFEFPFVNAGDPMGRFLVYYGAYGHAERLLQDLLKDDVYQDPANRAADMYHLGLAHLGMGNVLLAKGWIEDAAGAGASSAYQRANSIVDRILADRSEVQ